MIPKDDNEPMVNDLRRPFFPNWRQSGELRRASSYLLAKPSEDDLAHDCTVVSLARKNFRHLIGQCSGDVAIVLARTMGSMVD